GIAPALEAARLVADAGLGVMVGQMNEGRLATAAAAHLAMAARPRYAELYGADGLVDDPAEGLAYDGGAVRLAHAPGVGVALDRARTRILWEGSA
ncbi:MAG: enolase C-terminal domain-like protein, partial [Alphaproteobacteria bacterium]